MFAQKSPKFLKFRYLYVVSFVIFKTNFVCRFVLIRLLSPFATEFTGRSPSAMSTTTDTPTGGASNSVKLRPGTASHRRPRPISIATTGVMSASMYEKRSHSSNANTPTRTHHSGFDKSCNALLTFIINFYLPTAFLKNLKRH